MQKGCTIRSIVILVGVIVVIVFFFRSCTKMAERRELEEIKSRVIANATLAAEAEGLRDVVVEVRGEPWLIYENKKDLAYSVDIYASNLDEILEAMLEKKYYHRWEDFAERIGKNSCFTFEKREIEVKAAHYKSDNNTYEITSIGWVYKNGDLIHKESSGSGNSGGWDGFRDYLEDNNKGNGSWKDFGDYLDKYYY